MVAACWLTGMGIGMALEREANTTLTVPVDPPVFGYTVEPAFGTVRFTDPVGMATPPGETGRVFVVEQRGRIGVITNLAEPTRTVFLDIAARVAGGVPADERGLLGLAFHPGYADNGAFFVYYSTLTNGVLHHRLSRFQVSEDDPNRARADSEMILLSQHHRANNHNGGDLHFGPDGYLYVALGDEGGANDNWNNAQWIDRNFHAGILRIDVDRRPGSVEPNPHPAVFPGAYAVPADNPFHGVTEFNGRAVDPGAVRTEFWAVGLRNPWRMAFDPATGRLWTGDVGQGAREEINVITRGGNYGWAFREGTLNGPKASQAPAGFTSIPPVVQYSHGGGALQGRSVTGGVVYRGNRMSQLTGAYVFADYVSGNVWAIRWDGEPGDGSPMPPMERLTGRTQIAGFGVDPRNGDVLMAVQATDMLMRLTYSGTSTGDPLPPTLADTGAFSDLATMTPHAGIVPYDLNVPFWSDGALKERWFSVPGLEQRIGFHPSGPWSFPAGTVWIKHFELELVRGDPASRRRLETRFLVRRDQGVHGFTYRWTGATEAVLVGEEGMDETFMVRDGDVERTQTWRYPSRSECLQCHTPAGGLALGFSTAQLNRPVVAGEGVTNQIALLAGAGYFEAPPDGYATLPALAPADDETSSVEWRVRSWLDVNCAQCHQPGGPALGAWDARSRTPLSATGLIDGLLSDDEGDADNRLVVRGHVDRSMLHARVVRLGPGRMPPLASEVVDEVSAALLRRWIEEELPDWKSYAEWQGVHFEDPEAPVAAPEFDADGDGATNWLEYLTGTDPLDPAEVWAMSIAPSEAGVRLSYPRLRNRGFVVEWTEDLASPESWRAVESEANRFRIPAESGTAEWIEMAEGSARYFRVRVFEP
ncbi:MAG: PQQ-dependent sugar dehydrogenase [Verrucomicrobiae bacterium]|nr:PQQ-dependent sugar dehydrogenase [Verrucomicrobiae bacterium]